MWIILIEKKNYICIYLYLYLKLEGNVQSFRVMIVIVEEAVWCRLWYQIVRFNVVIDSLLAMWCYVTSVYFIFLIDDTVNKYTCVKIIVTSQLTHVKSILLGTQNYSSSDGIF